MNKSSRTSKSIKNSTVAVGFYIVNLVLQFFSRKIFLECLGTEILGLNTTAMNLLQFLNLAELGISSAVGFTLYKPLHDNNQTAINEIVTLQGLLYRRIAYFIIVGAIILMLFFPLIFAKIHLPLWYAYASFSILLFSAMLGYFVNYKQIILSASQQEYKVLYSYKSIMLIKTLMQIIAVWYFVNGYDWWLILEVIFAIIGSYSLHKMTMSSFPKLKTVDLPFKTLNKKFPDFTLKVKQLFFHKIGGFALTQSSPIIIYAYTSLSVVALYGNYIIVMSGLQALISALFNGINASIGDMITESNKEKELNIFFELFSLRFFISATVCICGYLLIPDFIKIWIGRQYLLSNTTLILLIIILYINVSRHTIDSFINAHGLYNDIWAPIIELCLNIGLSIIFGYLWGLNGVLMGIIASLFFVIILWKPYFLFKKKYNGYIGIYVHIYLKHIIAAIVGIGIGLLIWKCTKIESNDFISFINNCIIILLIFPSVIFIALVISKTKIYASIRRIIRM